MNLTSKKVCKNTQIVCRLKFKDVLFFKKVLNNVLQVALYEHINTVLQTLKL